MAGPVPASGYTLVLCEKPDAARRVTEALADSGVNSFTLNGIEAFEFSRSGERYVVCSASGHLYAVSDTFCNRGVYPVFDLEWFPMDAVDKDSRRTGARIETIRKLCMGAKGFVNACDFDVEGETIGNNSFRYARPGSQALALRAKFSTLTKDELVRAFAEMKSGGGDDLARAGRARHFLDFLWGVNFSRALSQSISLAGYGYRTISIGRVQGPTLTFVADREVEINAFVPTPHWSIIGFFVRDGLRFSARYSRAKIARKFEAQRIVDECSGRDGVVSGISAWEYREPPPFPFDIGGLQREAFRVFGFTPTRTLMIAERLYMNSLVSYPRTDSQKIPPSVDCRRIIENLAKMRDYADCSRRLLGGELSPRQGEKADQAHPSIYPTGEYPKRSLNSQERSLLDLIIKRFLALFCDDALRETVSASLLVGNHEFKLNGRKTVKEGWIACYRPYAEISDSLMPPLIEGDSVSVSRVDAEETTDSPPPRYNEASLLEKMEKEEIGTKATRAEIISTLIERGYMSGNRLIATNLGLSVVEVMRKYIPEMVSTKLTMYTEKHLGRIEIGEEDGTELIESVMEKIFKQIGTIRANMQQIAARVDESITTTAFNQSVLGACPACKTGKLRIIHSMKTRKRFVGCTNYPGHCTASAPLPQRGVLRPTAKPCSRCGWPVVVVYLRRYPWRFCVNMECPGKRKKSVVPSLQEKR